MLQTTNKIIKNKVGLLNLAEELRNVSNACKMMGFSRDTLYKYSSCRVYRACTQDGKKVNHGSSAWFYQSRSSLSCRASKRSCNDGSLGGSTSYRYKSCLKKCKWGTKTYNHGHRLTLYSRTKSKKCSSYKQVRTCRRGSWTGNSSYKYASCKK